MKNFLLTFFLLTTGFTLIAQTTPLAGSVDQPKDVLSQLIQLQNTDSTSFKEIKAVIESFPRVQKTDSSARNIRWREGGGMQALSYTYKVKTKGYKGRYQIYYNTNRYLKLSITPNNTLESLPGIHFGRTKLREILGNKELKSDLKPTFVSEQNLYSIEIEISGLHYTFFGKKNTHDFEYWLNQPVNELSIIYENIH